MENEIKFGEKTEEPKEKKKKTTKKETKPAAKKAVKKVTKKVVLEEKPKSKKTTPAAKVDHNLTRNLTKSKIVSTGKKPTGKKYRTKKIIKLSMKMPEVKINAGKFPELLTTKELTDIFKVSVGAIYAYVQLGMPTFSKRPLRFIESQCLTWIRER